jgi:HEAT repeat protein
MDQAALAGSGNDTKKGRSRMGMKGLMGAVALCALILWAGLSVRDQLAGYQPLRAIRTGNAIERRTAARDLTEPGRKINTEVAMAALIPTLSDEDAGVRASAAESIGVVIYFSRIHPPTVPVATDLLKRRVEVATRVLVPFRDPGVRAAAATGLGTMAKRPSAVPLATVLPRERFALLKYEWNVVRRQAAKPIYSPADVKLPPDLVAALNDESAKVRTAAARALAHFGPDLDPAIPALFLMLERERDEKDVRSACTEALAAAWPSPDLVPTLVVFLKSRDRRARALAAKLSGRIGAEAKETIPALIAVLNERFDPAQTDPSDNMSPAFPAYCAARALGQMGPDREAIAALVELISPEKVERALTYGQRQLEQDKRALAAGKLGKTEPPTVSTLSCGPSYRGLETLCGAWTRSDRRPPRLSQPSSRRSTRRSRLARR